MRQWTPLALIEVNTRGEGESHIGDRRAGAVEDMRSDVPSGTRFHLALGSSLLVGAFLLLADARAAAPSLLPLALVVLSLGLCVSLHRSTARHGGRASGGN